MPTTDQVQLAMQLLAQCGYATDGMNSGYLALGKAVNIKVQWPGSVEVWVETMSRDDASRLIQYLERIPQKQAV